MVRSHAVWSGLALAVLIASQPTGASAQNLAPNPSFESGTATTATGWTPCQTSGSSTFSIVGSPVHSGTRAARMDVKQSGDTFGAPGDVPLLGDFDGDGRVDACVFRAGVFLCDTAHDGGATPPARLLFGRPGDRPLLGNLDGL